MAKIDEIKEKIGAIKTYLGFIIAFIITLSAGVAKVYLDESSNILLLLGTLGIIVLSIIFAILARAMHKKIEKLRNL